MKAANKLRAKPDRKLSETYSLEDLCERYKCSAARLRTMWTREGFPPATKVGRKYSWSVRVVTEYEIVHMPHLHEESGLTYVTGTNDKQLRAVAAQAKAEREREAAAIQKQEARDRKIAEDKLRADELIKAQAQAKFLRDLKASQKTGGTEVVELPTPRHKK